MRQVLWLIIMTLDKTEYLPSIQIDYWRISNKKRNSFLSMQCHWLINMARSFSSNGFFEEDPKVGPPTKYIA